MERRKHIRYRLLDFDYQIFDQNNFAVGWIVDISDGGLSYEYIPANSGLDEQESINIFPIFDGGSFIPDLKYQKVYDIKADDDESYHIPVEFRRCGLKFRAITPKQRQRFQTLLEEIKYYEKGTI
jgi:hypothetical protein